MEASETKRKSPWLRTVRSFRFACAGLAYLLRTQSNAWVHLLATLAVVGLAAWLRVSRLEWVAVASAVGIVWLAEAFNTSVEAAVDLLGERPHPLAKVSKDVAAGGVLIAAVLALVIGALVFVPRLCSSG